MSLDKKQFLAAYRTMRTIRDFEYRVSDEFGKGNNPAFSTSTQARKPLPRGCA